MTNKNDIKNDIKKRLEDYLTSDYFDLSKYNKIQDVYFDIYNNQKLRYNYEGEELMMFVDLMDKVFLVDYQKVF